MKPLLLANGQVLYENKFISADILIDEGKIKQVRPGLAVPSDGRRVDLNGAWVAGGFIDLHFHGIRDKNVIGDDLQELGNLEAGYGVAGFVAGLVAEPDEICPLLERKKNELEKMQGGARCLGFYLEMPFAGLTGACRQSYLKPGDLGLAKEIVRSAGGHLKVMMVGPEIDRAVELIEYFVSENIVVALGHTNATVEQTVRAIDAGATLATHIYNVVPALPEMTEPGVWPVCCYDVMVADERMTCELVCDGIHVHPVKGCITYRAKGPERLTIITDCNVGAGLPPGRYQFPGRPEVEIRHNDAVRYTEKGGCLAGSAVSLDEAVRRSERVLGCMLPEACRMASQTVADVLNLGDRLGKIQPGYEADLTVLDSQRQPVITLVGGQIVWQKKM
jgi:N-acetylglucosamine-6-phosphate deacetylase